MSVGFIGLGNMGGHMARNLLKKGRAVSVFDISSDAVAALVADGATAAATPADAAKGANEIVTMLPSSPHVRDVYTSEGGVLSATKEGAVLVDSSTIDPMVSQEVSAAAAAAGCMMVDAPVSGGVGGAEAGTLTFMVGGSDEAFAASEDLLSLMGANIVHCGGAGTGQTAKLCNNLALAISMIGTSEAMNLGVRLGMDPSTLAGIMNTSTARCWSSDTYNPCPGVMDGVPASRGYEGGFGAALMLKDLGLAADAAKASGAAMPLGAGAREFYQMVVAHGEGHKDFGVAYRFLNGGDESERA